jgi:hypothetical protein
MTDALATQHYHPERPLTAIRSIGKWTLTGLVINCIIGSAIFGLPSILSRMLGTASPLAMIIAALMMSVIMACAIEVSSHFSDTGWLGVIRVMWPACPARVSSDGQRLLIDHAPAVASVQMGAGLAG